MTQYCEGVAAGAQICPASNTSHVGYPTGGALAGSGTTTPRPRRRRRAGTSSASRRLTPPRTSATPPRRPTGTPSTSSSRRRHQPGQLADPGLLRLARLQRRLHAQRRRGDLPRTATSPSLTCRTSRTPAQLRPELRQRHGTLDGVTIVEGHEYAETITDQNPAGGYTDSSGEENGDKCAWITPGQGALAGHHADHRHLRRSVHLGERRQRNAGGCEVTHAIVTNPGGGNTVTVTNPGNQTGTVGTAV